MISNSEAPFFWWEKSKKIVIFCLIFFVFTFFFPLFLTVKNVKNYAGLTKQWTWYGALKEQRCKDFIVYWISGRIRILIVGSSCLKWINCGMTGGVMPKKILVSSWKHLGHEWSVFCPLLKVSFNDRIIRVWRRSFKPYLEIGVASWTVGIISKSLLACIDFSVFGRTLKWVLFLLFLVYSFSKYLNLTPVIQLQFLK